MTTITIPHPTDPSYDERHGGPSRWSLTLTDAHYVWEKAGVDLRGFAGRKSGECSYEVKGLIEAILDDPQRYIAVAGYYDLRTTVAALTALFFTLRESPDGIVCVE